MEWKRVIRELELTRKDRIGFLVLAFLVLLSTFLPGFFRHFYAERDLVETDTAWLAELEAWMADSSGGEPGTDKDRSYSRRVFANRDSPEPLLSPFPFDPNTLDETGWLKLGLSARTIRIVLNYRNKGGRFRKKEDLARIYGISETQYASLEPFIQIAESRSFERYPTEPVLSPKKISPVDVNLGDTAAFIALPGIGSKLAARIISFREKLGGFYRISQVQEVYGLADSTYQMILPYLEIGAGALRKININLATEEELKSHPYIRYQLARPILAYRKEHGAFRSIEDLKNVMAVTIEVFEKIKPYLTVD